MEAKEILQKVKQYFNELAAPEVMAAPPIEPTEYELKDGGKVMIDVLEVGGIVMIDGSAALPGDIELVDGTKITIGDNGVITAITLGTGMEPAEPMAEPVIEDMGTKFAAFETLTSEKFANYENRFSAYEQRFADYEVKMKKATKVIDELLKLSTLLVEAPSQAPDSSVRTSNAFKEESKNLNILFN
ncbi:hypothetical protein UFOVP1384_51 [uncultured Caudovirales phage]|uniref:Uncharacterized protein n=1 Tax=uncultured Caudovirales phage TaxID=2100421 RepID=A0A6J5S701_9CAUD|nr:hypothetical protein UFOVP1384_51 [uncultured Caudovirales phage]